MTEGGGCNSDDVTFCPPGISDAFGEVHGKKPYISTKRFKNLTGRQKPSWQELLK